MSIKKIELKDIGEALYVIGIRISYDCNRQGNLLVSREVYN